MTVIKHENILQNILPQLQSYHRLV